MPHPEALWVMLNDIEEPLDVAVDREKLRSPNPMPRDAITRYVSQDVLRDARQQEREWFLELLEQLGYDFVAVTEIKGHLDKQR